MRVVLFFSLVIACLFPAGPAAAYDAVFNFSHAAPDTVKEFKVKYGPTTGGPYPYTVECGKPRLRNDGTYNCTGNNINLDPMYAVAYAYDEAGGESPPSNEAMYDPPPIAPKELKYTITGTVVLTPTE